MFSSKTLADRNNDPQPWLEYETNRRYTQNEVDAGNSKDRCWYGLAIEPRPEFQHGKLEDNLILVALRDHKNRYPLVERHLVVEDWLAYGFGDGETGWTPKHIAHAHRVLTLWLAVYGKG